MSLVLGMLFALTPAAQDISRDIEVVAKQGRGTPEGRDAWERIIAARLEALPALLERMTGSDTVADNWLRTAFEQIANREFHKGTANECEVARLLNFAKNDKNPGRARRFALEWLDELDPGASERLYPSWLEDPEFRYEAVAQTLAKARTWVKESKREQAITLFHQGFASSRDVQQARDAAAGLESLKEPAQSVGEHLGFLMDWYLIGPFDGRGQKGFHLEYPPEKKIDLTAELDGQEGKVRWKRYRVKEPPNISSGRHQALVNLCEKEALGNADDAVAFAYTEFAVAKAQLVEFRGAADDNFAVWVNGNKVFAFEEWRNGVRHDRHRFKVKLKEGKNTVLVKICQSAAPNPEPNWEFFLRVVDETGKGIAMRDLFAK
jgi:hypothetical protein